VESFRASVSTVVKFFLSPRAALALLAALSMAHVGSPDTFFTGKAGPYAVRVSVRLPGVIPGRAQVAVRVTGATAASGHRVTLQAGQWNVGLKGAPPPDVAVPVPGDPSLYATELWFMTATSYQLSVVVAGPSGRGSVLVPVVALATAERTMTPGLGAILGGLGVFLTLGLLTIIGSALRESGLRPGAEPAAPERRRARLGIAITAVLAALILWGGSRWWSAEATAYGRSVVYRPFDAEASVASPVPDRRTLTLAIRDPRWTGEPNALSRYNALLPDHGKLMHLFLVRESLDAFAHLHPIARTPQALAFAADLPPLPAGRYRVYGDIVHESGYAQTLVASVDLDDRGGPSGAPTDPDDSFFTGRAIPSAATAAFELEDRSRLVWARGEQAPREGAETMLDFSVRDASGAPATVEPYMGMAAHAIVASRDGSVFAHLHPSGSVAMAALQKLAGDGGRTDSHAGHVMPIASEVAIPYAFPKAGDYRIWVQVKRDGRVMTAAFDTSVR
jgi:hypothetical protein